MNFEEYLNYEVTLYGRAENSVYGPVLVCGPRSMVYIDGLPEWDAADVGGVAEVTGTLAAEGNDADLRAPDGSAMHGVGRRYIVKNASWEILP